MKMKSRGFAKMWKLRRSGVSTKTIYYVWPIGMLHINCYRDPTCFWWLNGDESWYVNGHIAPLEKC